MVHSAAHNFDCLSLISVSQMTCGLNKRIFT